MSSEKPKRREICRVTFKKNDAARECAYMLMDELRERRKEEFKKKSLDYDLEMHEDEKGIYLIETVAEPEGFLAKFRTSLAQFNYNRSGKKALKYLEKTGLIEIEKKESYEIKLKKKEN